MADYPISKEEVVRELLNLRDRLGGPFAKEVLNMALARLNGFPQMDAVPVVRCKDCVKRGTSYSCPMRKLVMPVEGPGAYEDCTEDMGFCHMGKRREGAA